MLLIDRSWIICDGCTWIAQQIRRAGLQPWVSEWCVWERLYQEKSLETVQKWNGFWRILIVVWTIIPWKQPLDNTRTENESMPPTHCRPAGVLWTRCLLLDSRLCTRTFPSPPAECWEFPARPETSEASLFWGCCRLSSSMWLLAQDCEERKKEAGLYTQQTQRRRERAGFTHGLDCELQKWDSPLITKNLHVYTTYIPHEWIWNYNWH